MRELITSILGGIAATILVIGLLANFGFFDGSIEKEIYVESCFMTPDIQIHKCEYMDETTVLQRCVNPKIVFRAVADTSPMKAYYRAEEFGWYSIQDGGFYQEVELTREHPKYKINAGCR